VIRGTGEVDLLAIELDPPLSDSPITDDSEQVPTRAFATSRRGFDRKQVDEFLDAVASRLAGLEKDLAEAQHAAEEARDHAPDEEAVERVGAEAPDDDGLDPRVRPLVEVLERETASMIAQARTEATRVIADAKDEAAWLRTDAQKEAARSIEEARASLEKAGEEARRILVDITTRRQQMLEGLQLMQERVLGVAQDLDDTLNPEGLLGTLSDNVNRES
jgi:DivIVA domain-containing protein